MAARIEATQGFDEMSTDALRALGAEAGCTVLAVPRVLDLPLLYQAGDTRVYSLAP